MARSTHPEAHPVLLAWVALALLLAGQPLLRAQNAWRPDPQSVTRANLWGVAYGADVLFAVGERGTLLRYAYDQPGWEARGADTTTWLLGVAYANGRWIIVGDGGAIFTSDDSGDTWQPRASGVTARLNAVAHGNGLWLAIGEQGTVITSRDGATWTARPALGTGFLRALAFGRGQFLIGGSRGALFATADAETFTRIQIPTTSDIEAAAISEGRYFVAGSQGLVAHASTLEAWTLTRQGSDATTFRGLVARSDNDASATGNAAAAAFNGAWGVAPVRPQMLVTVAALGRDEAIAVGFDGGIARSDPRIALAISPRTAANVLYGGDLRLSVVATGPASNVSYQWRHFSTDIPGATGPEFTIRSATLESAGTYSVRATAGGQTLLAETVRVNVVPAGSPEVVDSTFVYPFVESPSGIRPAPDGKVYITRYIILPTGASIQATARLNRDGSPDATFRPAIVETRDFTISQVLPDGRLIASGTFSGENAPRTALLRADGSIEPSFSLDPADQVHLPSLQILPDGRFIASTLGTTGIIRLLSSGARDPSFPPITGKSLIGVDSQGRILTGQGRPNGDGPVYSSTLIIERHSRDGLLEGTPIASYTSSDYPIGQWSSFRAMVGDWLYSDSRIRGKIYGSNGLDGVNSTDSSQRNSAGVTAGLAVWCPLPDGYIWDQRPYGDTENSNPIAGWQVSAIAPNRGFTRERFATLPDLSDYFISAVASDGVLYGAASRYIGGLHLGKKLIRIVPITGPVGRLTNLSVRAHVSAANPLIVGFVTAGAGSTSALVRGIGPSLAQFGVADALRDPVLTVRRDNEVAGTNDDWDSILAPGFASVGAFPLTAASADAAVRTGVTTGNYTAMLSAKGTDSGTGLLELFDFSQSPAPARTFVNVSARGPVGPGRPLIVGFTLTGTAPARVMIRGIGPTLRSFGVTDPLGDPTLKLFRRETALWENNNWDFRAPTGYAVISPGVEAISAAASVGAFALPLTTGIAPFATAGTNDSVMIVTLAPGSYTAHLTARGANSTDAGTALIEVYTLP